MINITIDPLLIPILLFIIAELLEIETKLARLEQKVQDYINGRGKNGQKD